MRDNSDFLLNNKGEFGQNHLVTFGAKHDIVQESVQREVQVQLASQRVSMGRARRELERQQLEREEVIRGERERHATRQWWSQLMASSTLTWVHTSWERGDP